MRIQGEALYNIFCVNDSQKPCTAFLMIRVATGTQRVPKLYNYNFQRKCFKFKAVFDYCLRDAPVGQVIKKCYHEF